MITLVYGKMRIAHWFACCFWMTSDSSWWAFLCQASCVMHFRFKSASNKEITEIYRLRWQIELLWKFLKMHLKLDRIITKNINWIEIQVYFSLISYLILKLVKMPEIYGTFLLDKLRYLQAFMCQKMSYVHWFEELVRCWKINPP